MRLQKYLASAGVASRRASEVIIAGGRVAIAGETVTDPARDVGDADRVTVDGALVRLPVERVVYALHKPLGVVSTAADPQGRRTVVSLVSAPYRLYPVGRLDIDTSGLILLTNDGALAHRLTHPSFAVPKTYRAKLAGPSITDAQLRVLRRGVVLDDGPTAPARVRRFGSPPDNGIELTIREGRNREVRRMCERVGHPVRSLQRVAVGSLQLGALDLGRSRRLTPEEVARLAADAGLEPIGGQPRRRPRPADRAHRGAGQDRR